MQPTPGTPVSNLTPQIAAPTQDEKTMALVAHFGAILTSFVAPLIVYLVKKEESKFVAFHALQTLYFTLACFAVIFVTSFILIGLFLWPIPIIFNILAGVKVLNGDDFEYPVVGKIARSQVFGN